MAGAGLAYFDGTAKTVLSGSDGSYSFQVSYLWSGTVTPSLYGYTFVPAFKTYSSVAADMPGQNYAAVLIMTPLPQAPLGTLTMNRPTYQWTRVVGAKQYQIQLELGSKVIYIKTLPATACVVNLCSNKPTTALADGAYKWRVRALIGTTWHAYSGFMAFKINTKPMAGYWAGSSEDFFVVPQQNAVKTFAIYITVQGCGNYKIWHSALAPIVNKHFAFSGALYASGAFSSLSAAKGVFGLNGLVIRGCGTLRGGPLSWRTSWINASQSFVPATVEVTSQELLPHGFDAWMPFITIQVVNP